MEVLVVGPALVRSPVLPTLAHRTVLFRIDGADCDAQERLEPSALKTLAALAGELVVAEQAGREVSTTRVEVRAERERARAGERVRLEVDAREVGPQSWALVIVVERPGVGTLAVLTARVAAS